MYRCNNAFNETTKRKGTTFCVDGQESLRARERIEKTLPFLQGEPICHPGSAVQSNTVIGVIATNAKLTKAEATKVAQMAQDGLARVIRPAHTMFDGDAIFALATGDKKVDVSMVGAFAAEAMAEAIVRAVSLAAPSGGLPGLNRQQKSTPKAK